MPRDKVKTMDKEVRKEKNEKTAASNGERSTAVVMVVHAPCRAALLGLGFSLRMRLRWLMSSEFVSYVLSLNSTIEKGRKDVRE